MRISWCYHQTRGSCLVFSGFCMTARCRSVSVASSLEVLAWCYLVFNSSKMQVSNRHHQSEGFFIFSKKQAPFFVLHLLCWLSDVLRTKYSDFEVCLRYPQSMRKAPEVYLLCFNVFFICSSCFAFRVCRKCKQRMEITKNDVYEQTVSTALK